MVSKFDLALEGTSLFRTLRHTNTSLRILAPNPFQELNADEIPSATKNGVTAIVIAGEALGISSPVQTRTPTHYM